MCLELTLIKTIVLLIKVKKQERSKLMPLYLLGVILEPGTTMLSLLGKMEILR